MKYKKYTDPINCRFYRSQKDVVKSSNDERKVLQTTQYWF